MGRRATAIATQKHQDNAVMAAVKGGQRTEAKTAEFACLASDL
jgi:hypothetical protein